MADGGRGVDVMDMLIVLTAAIICSTAFSMSLASCTYNIQSCLGFYWPIFHAHPCIFHEHDLVNASNRQHPSVKTQIYNGMETLCYTVY